MKENQPGDLPHVDRGAAPKIDVGKALEMRLKGKSLQEIGDEYGVTRQAVCQRLRKFTKLLKDPDVVLAYERNQVNLLRAVDMELTLGILDRAHSHKSSVNNLAYAKDKVFTHIRLLTGESTANVSNLTRIIQAALGEAKKDREVEESERKE